MLALAAAVDTVRCPAGSLSKGYNHLPTGLWTEPGAGAGDCAEMPHALQDLGVDPSCYWNSNT